MSLTVMSILCWNELSAEQKPKGSWERVVRYWRRREVSSSASSGSWRLRTLLRGRALMSASTYSVCSYFLASLAFCTVLLKKKRMTREPNLRWSVLFITLGPGSVMTVGYEGCPWSRLKGCIAKNLVLSRERWSLVSGQVLGAFWSAWRLVSSEDLTLPVAMQQLLSALVGVW